MPLSVRARRGERGSQLSSVPKREEEKRTLSARPRWLFHLQYEDTEQIDTRDGDLLQLDFRSGLAGGMERDLLS